MSALSEAREHKRFIEAELVSALEAFTEHTGLAVLNGNISRIEITNMGEEHPKYRYHVDLDIRVG